MTQTLVKVYADFSPANASMLGPVGEAGQRAVGHDAPWLFYEDDRLRISWEGVYFPLEDVLHALAGTLGKKAEGQLDYLDLENWRLTRCVLRTGAFHVSRRSLNQVLEYSGH
ncbi:MAG: hypothetical protein LBD42_00355 [Desulfovibrio sp.]|nr:hypothetical protein [Desulfovibrio sp.]